MENDGPAADETAASGTDADDPGSTPERVLHLASWDDRFVAWLIDVVLVGAVLSTFGEIAGLFTFLTGGFVVTTPFLGVNGLGLWLYWTALEGYQGQSAGKLVMSIAVTDERGDEIDYVTAGIESFGKAFLLPIDLLVGWIFMDDEYVRLFNRLSGTIVVEREKGSGKPEGVEYVRPKD